MAADAQGDEEDAEDDEVEVELGVLHVQLLQHVRRLCEDALRLAAVQLPAVTLVDGLQHPLK